MFGSSLLLQLVMYFLSEAVDGDYEVDRVEVVNIGDFYHGK